MQIRGMTSSTTGQALFATGVTQSFRPWQDLRIFRGNRCIKSIYDHLLVGDRTMLSAYSSFLHGPQLASLVFNGLCALETADLTWFEDRGRPIRNYRYSLSILDEEFVNVDWLRSRVVATSKSELMEGAPESWADYIRGRTRRRQLWRTHVRRTEAQQPRRGSSDEGVLQGT